MPKSMATMRPSVVDEEIALMHVGVKEAVAQGVAQEGLDQGPRRAWARRSRARRGAPCRRAASPRSIPSSGLRASCGPNRSPGRGTPGSRFRFSANSDAAAASRRKSISMRTLRASVSTTSTRRSRRRLGSKRSASRAAKNISERSRAKRRSTPGRSSLTATSRSPSRVRTRARCTCAIEAAATASPNSTKTRVDLGARRPPRPSQPRWRGRPAPCGPAAFRAPSPPWGRRCRGGWRGTARA